MFPNDTDLVVLNGGSGNVVNEGIQVLRSFGEDAFWSIDARQNKWWQWSLNNVERERIPQEDLNRFRVLLDRSLALDRCKKLFNKIGINPEAILKGFDLTRVQGGFSWGTPAGYGGTSGGSTVAPIGSMTQINQNPRINFVILTFVHENFHPIPEGGDDHQMAKLFQDNGLFPPPQPNISTPSYKPGNLFWNSFSWDTILGNACQPTDKELKSWQN